MELYLQMGHGMQGIAQDLIKSWGKGKAIISPVNFIKPNNESVETLSKKIRAVGGQVLFDPQMFYPKEGHTKLQGYDYWPADGVSIASENVHQAVNRELLRINNQIGSAEIILPGLEMNENQLGYGLDWMLKSSEYFLSKTDKPLLATLCLYPETIRNSESIEALVSHLREIPVHGYYIIPHPANNEYIVSDPSWVIGVLKLVACLKLAKKRVVVGYSSHQGLVYALANSDGIASGTYMNTRSFVPSKFKSPKDDDIKHKSTWYYLPSAFSEYKAALLDVAQQRGYLDFFIPRGEFENSYSAMLFRGAQPSTTNYNETNSFKHYLFCLKKQCDMLTKDTYRETFDTYDFMLNSAENQIREIKKRGMSGQNRDFAPAIEANRVAMYANNEDYGLKLQLEWQCDL
ncbi:hypothetical protein LJC27_04440 [Christensenellaceae bacterium OttesenSCG-928-M15]|nr:hypothetical protein [Christensenellaceae bacterium OttesenSCG-928-M15]